MFGYILPCREELRVRELEQFQSAYCGLCHTLGRRYGFGSRFLLNYDFTFLAMLLSPGTLSACERRRCAVSPFRPRSCCPANEGMEAAADESVILTWWKLRDQVEDSGCLEGLPARLLCWLFRPAYRKAAKLRPAFDAQVREQLARLGTLEKERCPSLDRPADTFARILQAAAPASEDEARRRAMEQLLYHVGRWIYLADAWDDRKEDRKRGGYNPVNLRYGLPPGGEGDDQAREQLGLTLLHSRNLALSAFYLLEPGDWSPILENILCLGMPMVEHLVLTDQWRTKKKKIQQENGS
ncbi:MAG: hypothetical protein HFF18_07035 [Oscillospiraceae bacterium]|nr:hypothetical protein [Oscillospiraceae bacterium]